MTVAAELMANYCGKKGWVGVAVKGAAGSSEGIKVASIEEKSPAETAGVKAGDTVTRVGSVKVQRALDFQRAFADAVLASRWRFPSAAVKKTSSSI